MSLNLKIIRKAIKKSRMPSRLLVIDDETLKQWKKLPTSKLTREYIQKIDSQLELLRMLLYSHKGKICVGIEGDADVTKYLSKKLKKEILKIIKI